MIRLTRLGNSVHVQALDPAIQQQVYQKVKDTCWYWYKEQVKDPKELAVREKLFREGKLGKMRPDIKTTRIDLWAPQSDSIMLPRGLVFPLMPELKKFGVPIEMVDARKKKPPALDWSRLPLIGPDFKWRYGQEDVMKQIDTSNGGLIVCATGFGKSMLMACVSVMDPKSKIACIVPGNQLMKSLHTRLLRYAPGQVGMIGAGKYQPEKRVLVVSASSIDKAPLSDCGWIFYDEVHSLSCKRGGELSTQHTDAKWIGFTASHGHRFDGNDALSEALFGPVLMEVSYQEAVAEGNVRPIDVHWIEVNRSVKDIKQEDYLPPGSKLWRSKPLHEVGQEHDKKKHVYWINPVRNHAIAQFARRVPAILGEADPQILIMCSSVQHMFALREYLPDYEMAYSECSDDLKADLVKIGAWRTPAMVNAELISALRAEGRWSDDDLEQTKHTITRLRAEGLWKDGDGMDEKKLTRMTRDFEVGKVRKVIANYVWKQGIDPQFLSAFIRADGGSSGIQSIQLPGRLSRIDGGLIKGLLADCNDKFDPWTEKMSKARRKAYEDMGYTMVAAGVQPPPGQQTFFGVQS